MMSRLYSLPGVLFLLALSLLLWLGKTPPTWAKQAASLCNKTAKEIKIDWRDAASLRPIPLRPLEPVLFESLPPMTETGALQWYIDGVRQDTPSTTLCYVPATAGLRRLELIRASDNQNYSLTLSIDSYSRIRFASLTPNPIGQDRHEEIRLENKNDFPVTLKQWKLHSRTTSTNIPINITIPSSGEATVVTNQKLRNSGGTYDLYNESGELVDSVTYAAAPEGTVETRSGDIWPSLLPKTTTGKKTSGPTPLAKLDAQAPVRLSGRITLPKGRSFDIMTNDHKSVHVVLHKSFTGAKPKLHQGDMIELTGYWRTGKHGDYISVRDGNELNSIERTRHVAPAKAKETKKSADHLLSAKSAQAAETIPAPSQKNSNQTQPHSRVESIQLPLTEWLRWLFVGSIVIGAWLLLLPTRPQKPV